MRLTTRLTFHPVAESVPCLAEVLAGAVVHDAHVTEATVGVGVGGGVADPGLVQPAGCTQVQAGLHKTTTKKSNPQC